ncbi:integrase [Klebsiella michiganensis]|nr:integrase [Klebsiella michiganensis]
MDFSFQQARKQVADGVSPTQARQLDKIRKVNEVSNTFKLIAKEWLQMKDWAELPKRADWICLSVWFSPQ